MKLSETGKINRREIFQGGFYRRSSDGEFEQFW